MKFIEHSFRHASSIIKDDELLSKRYKEFTDALTSITDEELINDFNERRQLHNENNTNFKSLTPSINYLLKEKLKNIDGWESEVDIFNDTSELGNTEWRLDFACENAFAVEVAFNHGEAIAWNLLKPVLASELNHVQKKIQTQLGIYVCATNMLKLFGNIDNASGSFEKVIRYLKPLNNQLTIPIMIIGLEAPETFYIDKSKKLVQDYSNYTLSYQQLLYRVKENANENSIQLMPLIKTIIVDNKKISQRFSLFNDEWKIGIYNKTDCQEIIDDLMKNDYDLFKFNKTVTHNELLNLLTFFDKKKKD